MGHPVRNFGGGADRGIYVPSLYDVTYHPDGTVSAVTPKDGVRRRWKAHHRRLGQGVLSGDVCVPFMETA
ncbi:MAG: hypothetical protein ACLR5S_04900 [Ruminococcus sp.]